MSGRRRSFTDTALAISVVLAVGLGGLLFHLSAKAAGAEEAYAQAKRDYEMMIKLREQYRALEARRQKLPQGSAVKPETAIEFLSLKATEAGLTNPRIVTEPPVQSALWREQPWTLAVDGGTSGTVPRRGFIRFLDLVESQSPSFKSKSISLRFAVERVPDDLTRASVTFSHFERR